MDEQIPVKAGEDFQNGCTSRFVAIKQQSDTVGRGAAYDDPNQSYGYNPPKHVAADYRSLAASGMLDALLVTTIGLAGFSRADLEPAARRLPWVYMDEFQNFTTLSIADMLFELRSRCRTSSSSVGLSSIAGWRG